MEKFEEFKKPISKSENLPHYNFEKVFDDLERIAFPLVERLKESIDNGDYDMLIGDDASGRLPTLALRGVINERNRKLCPDLKLSESEIKTRFVAGGQNEENKEELKKALEKLKPEIKKKALVVTEYIQSGESMARISKLLENLGISFDVAAFTSEKDKLEIPENSKFFYGGTDHYIDAPSFYCIPEMSGIVKDCEPGPYAISNIKKWAGKGADLKVAQEKINKARKDVDLLVNKIIERVWGKK